MKLWHVAALLAAGLAVGELVPGLLAEPFSGLTLNLFLPALIFEAAWHLDARTMLLSWRPIVLLVVPGVALTAAVVSVILARFGGVEVGTALLIGAILCATDPVAVVAIFRRVRAPKAISTIVQSESLLNDAIAVLLYRVVLVAVLATASVGNLERVSLLAVLGSLGGIAIGCALGLAGAIVLRGHLGAIAQTIATFVVAYGGYALAGYAGCSGLFAVIAGAIAMREMERRHLSPRAADKVERVWDIAATLANIALFFLIGAAVEVGHLAGQARLVLATLVAVLIARLLLAYGLMALVPEMPSAWKSLVRMAGMRGALSLALALAIPASFPGRDLVIDAVFAVVVVTVFIGTLTFERRIARLSLKETRRRADPPGAFRGAGPRGARAKGRRS